MKKETYPLCNDCVMNLACDNVPELYPEDDECVKFSPKNKPLTIEKLGYKIFKPVFVKQLDGTPVGHFIVEDVRVTAGSWYIHVYNRSPFHYKTFIFTELED